MLQSLNEITEIANDVVGQMSSSTAISMLKEIKIKIQQEHTNWHETHFEVVTAISHANNGSGDNKVTKRQYIQGTGGLYEMAQELTDKFQEIHKNTDWGEDLEFFETIEEFMDKEINE